MNPFQLLALSLGRICLSVFFILSAVFKIIDWQGSELDIINALENMHVQYSAAGEISVLLNAIGSHVSLFLLISIAIELIGGICIFLGIKPGFNAFLLALLLIPSTYLFHPFWILQGHVKEIQMAFFMKNLSIFGGLLILCAGGNSKPRVKMDKTPAKIG